MSKPNLTHRLPVREDVTHVTYHRQPTASEIRFGMGAVHYANFAVEDACHLHDGRYYLKAWFKGPQDGLRYYR